MCSSINVNELILQAVEEKNEEKIWWCIQAGANVNYQDPMSDFTPLFIIATCSSKFTRSTEEAQSQARIAELLIKAGADLNNLICFEVEYLTDYLTALEAAVYFRNAAVVSVLLDYGADVNVTSRYNGFTALHYAVDDNFSDVDIVKKLLRVQDIQVNSGCLRHGNTPLHLAVMREKNSEEIVELLLKHGADAEQKNRRGMSPMQEYLENALSLRMKNLYFRGIDPALLKLIPPSESDTSPLHMACVFHKTSEVRKLALADEGMINTRDRFGHTPLFYAVMSRGQSTTDRNSTVRLLLNLGAEINHQFGRYNLDVNIDVDQEEEGSYSILDIAILLGDYQVSIILLQHMAKLVAMMQSDNEENDEEKTLNRFNLDLIYWRDEQQRMSDLWRYCVDCREELRAMKKSKVGESPMSFFDLLTLDAKKSTLYAKRKKLVEAFETGMCSDVFPIYRGSVSYTNFGTAVEHRKLAEDAAELLSGYLRFAEPRDVFYEKTLSYLDNDDLKRPALLVEEYRRLWQRGTADIEATANKLLFDDSNLALIDGFSKIKSFYDNCNAELRAMKNCRIKDTTITYFAILTEPVEVIAMYTRNEELAKVFESIRCNISDYPIYNGQLKVNVNAATARI